MHVTLLIQFLDLQRHCGLQMASEVKSDLGFEIRDCNYPHIHVHVTLLVQFLDLRGHCGLQTALEVKYDLRFEIRE